MSIDKMNTATAQPATTAADPRAEKPDLVKTIGKTTYQVKIHFNPNSRETMQDKIIRMLRNEVGQM